MSKPVYYKVSTYSGKKSGKNPSSRKNMYARRRMQMVASIVGAYVLVGGLISFLVFNIARGPASASESAYISASLKITEEKDQYNLGDEVVTKVTLQNTSLKDPINSLILEMQSTSNSVEWNAVEIVAGRNQGNVIEAGSNSFELPVLTAGERVEYLAKGTLQDNSLDYITIVGKMQFLNTDGVQEATTNKVFTPLNSVNSNQNKLLSLATDKTEYGSKQKIEFDLRYLNENSETLIFPEIKGKIYVSKIDSQELVTSLDCELNESGFCANSLPGLDAGKYSALFISEKDSQFSQIINFEVKGNTTSFTPSTQSSLSFPFGSSSENGIVPVHAQRVMNLNQTPDGEECIFDVYKSGKLIKSFKSSIESERICFTNIATAELPSEGIYTVKLRGTEQKRDVSFLNKGATIFELKNEASINESGKAVSVKAEGLVDENGNVLEAKKFDISIWHPRSGEYKVVSSISGQSMVVEGGKFNVQIPAEYFAKGGYYNVFAEVEDGQQSGFLGVSFDGNKVSFSKSGVLVEDYNALRVGRSQIFKVNEIKDRSGNIIDQGSCGAQVYQSGDSTGILVNGEIKGGECRVVVAPGVIKKAGPVLVSFSGDQVESDIYASRQFNFWPSDIADYGALKFEFEPVRFNTANTLIVGPVIDQYSNPSYGYDLKTEFIYVNQDGLEEVIKVIDTTVSQGYAQITVPANILERDNVRVKLKDFQGNIVLQRDVQILETDKSLILPNFPRKVESSQNLEFGVTGLGLSPEEITTCNLRAYKTLAEYSEIVEDYSFDEDGCNFAWQLNEKRSVENLLLELAIGENIYTSVLSQTPSEAASLFEFVPQVKLNQSGDLEVSFLSSPIIDKNGLPIKDGKVRIQFNGKVEEASIENGFAKFEITSDKISSSDIRNILEQRFLDVSVEARASSISISKTSDFSLYLGTKDIVSKESKFEIKQASTNITQGVSDIFAFKTESCNPIIVSHRGANPNIKHHWQGGACYVEVEVGSGSYSILFENDGFDIGSFNFNGKTESQNIIWCDQKPCSNQVLGDFDGSITAILYDEGSQYTFETDEIDDVITIEQNGLNPLKDYLLQIKYKNLEGEEVSFYKEIKGEYLIK